MGSFLRGTDRHARVSSGAIVAFAGILLVSVVLTALSLLPSGYASTFLSDPFRWDDGIAYAEESIRLHPRYWYAHVLRICCLSRKGEADDAREAYHELMQQRPDFSERHIRWVPFLDQHWNEYMIDGLQLAAPPTSESAE
jgi:tetratricopeptide (TPR) repeat protein